MNGFDPDLAVGAQKGDSALWNGVKPERAPEGVRDFGGMCAGTDEYAGIYPKGASLSSCGRR